jgi:hypothetical protein
MKKQITRIWAIALLSLALSQTACKKGSEAAPNTCQAASQKGDELSAAAQAYASDPTNTTKCQAYKKAATDYINAADKCTTIPQTDINAARDAVNSLTCN